MTSVTYSPREAAAMSGAPLAVIQKAISAGRIPASIVDDAPRRQIDETALLAFALAGAMPAEINLSPGAAYDLLRRTGDQTRPVELGMDGLVRIDTGKALAETRRRIDLYRRARAVITSNPEIMGGEPTIRGTRITARAILGRIKDGETLESILDDYPYLDRETLEAAALYARANPPRGRPSGQLWRRAS